MKITLSILFALITLTSGDQDLTGDQLKTKNGNIILHPVQHGSLVIQWGEKIIYVDPYGGEEFYHELPAPDIILITDIHGDHLNKTTLAILDISKATFVVPKAVEEQLEEKYKSNLRVLNNGEHLDLDDITISAIPMYNLPKDEESRHTKGRGNGYILTIDEKLIYISGDTEDIPEMMALRNIDVAFICMNLPYTMDVAQAANAVLTFKPAIVYPYHYRGSGGLSDVNKFKSIVNEGDPRIDVRLREWYKAEN